MIETIKKWWKYLTARADAEFDKNADPKIQLEQAIRESKEQHQRLKEQAANVIAHQKQTEMRLEKAMVEMEKLTGNARQAVMMADDAVKRGDDAKAMEYTSAAESFAQRLIAVEEEVDALKALHLQATESSDEAKSAVSQNSARLQSKLAERQKLMSQLDQAKMKEQMNDAMSSLGETVGGDTPTLDEVREKIEGRLAKAQAASDLNESSTEGRMAEIEAAARNTQAKARLEELKSQLGVGSTETATPTEAAAPETGGTTATAEG
ncbi:MAG: PspA/IM30 family protein [Acidimicrobiales bacterium]|nr:PspA/IM30 family protein [Acidimicrobiales bacterium]RZV45997.1 MAG: PspA/IM30 family protein [Acidimicrobiales bacterium]